MKSILLLTATSLLTVAAGESQPPPPQANARASAASTAMTAGESLDLRYARAQLKLAEANLDQAQYQNRRVAGVVSGDVVGEFRETVAVARLEVEAAAQRKASASFEVWLRRAEARARVSESEYRNAMSANRQIAGAVQDGDVLRLRLQAELAQVEYQRGRQLADATPDKQQEWIISLMSDEIQQLRTDSLRKQPGGAYYYRWR